MLHEEEAALFLDGLRGDLITCLPCNVGSYYTICDYVRIHLPWMKSIKTLDVMKQVFTEPSATKMSRLLAVG